MLKALFGTAAALTCTFGGLDGLKAEARTQCVDTTTDHTICYRDNGHSGADLITAWNSEGTLVSEMTVICTGGGGNRWSANTAYSKAENQKLANGWCDDYQ